MSYLNIKREEELKNRIAQDYFTDYDCTRILGAVDFCVSAPEKKSQNTLFEAESLLWAEAKLGDRPDIYLLFVQLILTIGKARTFDEHNPPPYLGAFDAKKIAFIPFISVQEIFYQNDFNWNVAPSNSNTKEFKQVYKKVRDTIENQSTLFEFDSEGEDLSQFIKENFIVGKESATKIRIDKNNFILVYNKWLKKVLPTIAFNWGAAKKEGIISGDFYLADLLADGNTTLKDGLSVVLKVTKYEMNRFKDEYGAFHSSSVEFNDRQRAHTAFWNKYERPPKEEYWDYIINRRDLLVPLDVRERKGSFFTPQIWVEFSQQYIADVLGDDWQDEYYIWDCAAGTGNLLAGLTNKYHIWASTLDRQDVDVMRDRIENGANLLEDHIFQFDFLNDPFTQLPENLREIINDPAERKKLVIYINPPYAEVSSVGEKGKAGVNKSRIHDKYAAQLGTAGREIFTQFMIRIFNEIHGCKLAEFSKLKVLQGSAFENFRQFFEAKLEKCFVVPANSFDNVKGNFPIGFKIWDTGKQQRFKKIKSDIFDSGGNYIGKKLFYAYDNVRNINQWITSYKPKDNSGLKIGFLAGTNGNDFQQNKIVYILNSRDQMANPRGIWICKENLIAVSIYNAVRHCVDATWLNDRDLYLYPHENWKFDKEFQSDCFAYTLFDNNIQESEGTNHWIPYTEEEVSARSKFKSNFMTSFISGNLKESKSAKLFDIESDTIEPPIKFSPEAKSLLKAGKKLWKYYHSQPGAKANASLYDIRSRFQGRNPAGKMNPSSEDEIYTELSKDMKYQISVLKEKIEPKVYEHGFLKG